LGLECQQLELAAHWSDLHHPDSQAPTAPRLPGAERGRELGGDGTPKVLEFAATELGASLHTSSGSARSLMADALDLRHRLPELWQHILAGAVPAWKARKGSPSHPASQPRLSVQVDAAVAGSIWGCRGAASKPCPPPRSFKPTRAAEDQAKIWEAERFVRAGRSGQSGLKLLIAKANAGDVIWFPAGALGGVGPGGGVGAGPTSLAAAAYGHRLRTAG
jgi:hypothetical protein